MPDTVFVVHFCAGPLQPFSVIFFLDSAGKDSALTPRNTAFGKPLCNPVLYYLTDGAEFLADGLRLSNQCLEDDIRFTLFVAKVPTKHLRSRLELAIDTPIALF